MKLNLLSIIRFYGWLNRQKLEFFLPTFVFENVIRQLNEIISNQGAPLKDTFQRKIDDLGIQSEEKVKLKSSLQKLSMMDLFQATKNCLIT